MLCVLLLGLGVVVANAFVSSRLVPYRLVSVKCAEGAKEVREVSLSSSKGSLSLLNLEVGVQEDPNEYLRMITRHVSRDRVLRWYISRIDEDSGICTLEVVVSA